MSDLTIGVDIGGTKILAGVVDGGGTVLSRVRIPTPKDEAGIARAITDAVDRAREGWDGAAAIGVGAAGYVDESRSVVRSSPNLDWHDEPLKEMVERHSGLPVVIENDANAAAWGEYVHGAAADHTVMVMVTVGTGLGGGIVAHDRLWRGRFGIGGEIGHYRAVPKGLPCHCGRTGCMEQYASGTAHTRRTRAAAAETPHRARILLSLGDGTPEGVQGPHIQEAALRGDPVAAEAFIRTGQWLGQALADLAAVLDPGVFVLGGGVSGAGDLLLKPTEAAYRLAPSGAGERPFAEVVLAGLGPDAGLVGAADLARRP
ncbi:ROK family glucokinase [Streptacidiphilus carbonis]|uniref:ROK family glucokinase n=1 Tax=Streptacidiphilus carbonis TaxID=105422 RepID=UPI0005A739A2|nr:ROK family glucokinase [Streptacidiphilus carbonis]